MEDVFELEQQIELLQSEIQKQEEILLDRMEEFDSLKDMKADLQMTLAKSKQKHCEHLQEVRSYRLESDNEIHFSLKCSKCGMESKIISRGNKTFASRLEYGRTYYKDYSGNTYFIEDGTPKVEVFRIHLERIYLPAWDSLTYFLRKRGRKS